MERADARIDLQSPDQAWCRHRVLAVAVGVVITPASVEISSFRSAFEVMAHELNEAHAAAEAETERNRSSWPRWVTRSARP